MVTLAPKAVARAAAFGWRRARPRTFTVDGQEVPYLVALYNSTWMNERTIEVPLARAFIAERRHGRGLEIGNVLSHYGPVHHRVVDKYEVNPGVENIDALDVTGSFDWVVSISTLEHVGWDETPREEEKVVAAFQRMRSILAAGGRAFVTCPVGYNPILDNAITTGRVGPVSDKLFAHDERTNRWSQVGAGYEGPREFDHRLNRARLLRVAQFGG